jgi:hypothetical protein
MTACTVCAASPCHAHARIAKANEQDQRTREAAWPDPARGLVDRLGGDPWLKPDPLCWQCHGRAELVVSRNHTAHPETAAWRPGMTFGTVDCPACRGTGLREGAGRCDDCNTPVPEADDGLCLDCASLPRCSRCALRLDPDEPDGSLCDDCRRDARIDFEINLGDL